MNRKGMTVISVILVLIAILAVSCKAEAAKVYANLDLGDGESMKVEVIDGKITLPEATEKTGYDFVKWTVDGTDMKEGESVDYKEGMKIEAVYSKKRFKVTFASGIEDVAISTVSQSVEYGEKAKAPETPTLTTDIGKEFDYWAKDDGTAFEFDKDVITETTVLTAVWKYKTYNIGDTGPAGGIVFYDAGSEQTNSYYTGEGMITRTWRYLEYAPVDVTEDNTTTFIWSTKNNETIVTSDGLGDGFSNTYSLVTISKTDGSEYDFPAAKMAANYRSSKSEYTDWYLPSFNEASEMGKTLAGKESGYNGFYSGEYWTSSTRESNSAWTLYLTTTQGTDTLNSANGSESRTSSYRVRAIRQF